MWGRATAVLGPDRQRQPERRPPAPARTGLRDRGRRPRAGDRTRRRGARLGLRRARRLHLADGLHRRFVAGRRARRRRAARHPARSAIDRTGLERGLGAS